MDSEETPKSEIILYQTEDSRTRIQCRFENKTLSHIAASICGHTEEVAKENYRKVGEEDLDRTMEKLSTIHSKLSPSVALNIALLDDVKGLNPSSSDSEGLDQGTKKPQGKQGFPWGFGSGRYWTRTSCSTPGNLSELPAAPLTALPIGPETDEKSAELLTIWFTLESTQRDELLALARSLLSRQRT